MVERLAVLGGPASLTGMAARTPAWRAQIAAEGVRPWVRGSNAGRMGSRMSPAQLAWWESLMSGTAASTLDGFLRMVPSVDVTAEVGTVSASSGEITTSVERAWFSASQGAASSTLSTTFRR